MSRRRHHHPQRAQTSDERVHLAFGRPVAVPAGHSVLFTKMARMLSDLGSVYGTPHLFQQRLRKHTRVELLVCDEVGGRKSARAKSRSAA